jgi:hypothetical protein
MKQWIICFYVELNESCNSPERILVLLEVMPKLCIENTKLLHPLKNRLMSSLNSNNGLSHIT